MRRQLAWSFSAKAIGLILPPLLVIVLARLLEPADFGIFALLSVVVAGIQTVSVAPLGEAIIKSNRGDIGDFIFTVQLVTGIILSLLLLVWAEHIALFFKEPKLAAPLKVSCLLLLCGPLVETAVKLNVRNLEFKAVFVRRVVSPIANALIAIPMAIYGMGYWALVWGQIVGIIMSGAVVLAMGGWKPCLNFRLNDFADDLRFSWQMLLQGMMRWIRSQSDKAILGYYISSQSLGSYDMARRLPGIAFQAIIEPVSQVMYAVMSKKIRCGEDVQDLFILAQRRILMVSLPLCGIILINAEELINILLGKNWQHILPVFELMIIAGALSSIVGFNAEIFKAKGKPHIMTRFMLIRGVATLIVFLLVAPRGIQVLALGVVGLGIFFSPINVYLTLKLLGIRIQDYLLNVFLRPTIIAITVAVTNLMLHQFEFNSIAKTILSIFTGGIIILAAAFYWERDIFKRKPK